MCFLKLTKTKLSKMTLFDVLLLCRVEIDESSVFICKIFQYETN